jgi:hypothetical protein
VSFDVFISYSSNDKAAADAACAVLESAGIRCWIAPRDIRPGVEYGGAIIDAIDHCRAMILVFSASANESGQIRREIERAVAKAVPILPVRIEEVTPTKSLEYFLGAIHWLDALSPPLEQHLHQLAETVQAMLKIEAKPPGEIASGAALSGGAAAVNALPPRATRYEAKKQSSKWLVPAISAGALLLLVAGGLLLYRLTWSASPGSVRSTAPQGGAATLRQAAQERSFLIGADGSTRLLRDDLFYAQTLRREYNLIGSGSETWFSRVQKSRTEADFSNVDALVEFALANGMRMRGTALVSGPLPSWLSKANLSAAENTAIFKEFVQSMVRRYRGRVYSGTSRGAPSTISASCGRHSGRRILATITWSRLSYGHMKPIRRPNCSYTTITIPDRSRRGQSRPTICCENSGHAESPSMAWHSARICCWINCPECRTRSRT